MSLILREQALDRDCKRRLGDNLLDEMRRPLQKAWDLLDKAEAAGDLHGPIVALKEVRECLGSLGDMLAQAGQTQTPNVHVLLCTQAATLEAMKEIAAFQRENEN